MNDIEPCPVNEALTLIGGKWSLQIINQMRYEKKRFGELKKMIPSISEKMLIQELKKLTKAGLLNRKSYNAIPPKVEYSLTEKGRKLLPIIEQIKEFGMELITS